MKKYVIRLIALLIFASVAMSSCSLEYRQRHGRTPDRNQNQNHDRGHDRDNHYNEVHHN